MKRAECSQVRKTLKFCTSKRQDKTKSAASFSDTNVDLSDLGPIDKDWFSSLTALRLQQSGNNDEDPPGERQFEGCQDEHAEIKSESEKGRAPCETDLLVVSDSWDSPRLPYTWTPGSSIAHSPDTVPVPIESRGSSKSSSPSSLALSLGVNLEGSVFSWTSSLETPPGQSPAQMKSIPVGGIVLEAADSQVLPKRFPRALFSPSKADGPSSSVLGIHTIDDIDNDVDSYNDDMDQTVVPFVSSPCSLPSDRKKVEDSHHKRNRKQLTSTPTASRDIIIPNSPGHLSVIETVLSDFFDSPISSYKTRRKHAPGKKPVASVGDRSPLNISACSTPMGSPLISILSSEKKAKTPTSAKRVRFADVIETQPNPLCNSKKELHVPASQLSYNLVINDKSYCPISCKSVKKEEPVDRVKEGNCCASVQLHLDPHLEVSSEVNETDMFSQISEGTLQTMCQDGLNITCKCTVENNDGESKSALKDKPSVENLNYIVLKKEITDSDSAFLTPEREVITSSVSTTPQCMDIKEEDVFTQISPTIMESIINSTRTIELTQDNSCLIPDNNPMNFKQEPISQPSAQVAFEKNKMKCGETDSKKAAHGSISCTEIIAPDSGNSLRKRKTKSKSFLYPSAKQIDKTCPKRVFTFKKAEPNFSEVKFSPTIIINKEVTESINNTTREPQRLIPVVSSTESPTRSSQEAGTSQLPLNSVREELFPCAPSRPRIANRPRLSSDFKTFTEMILECEKGLLDSSFEDTDTKTVQTDYHKKCNKLEAKGIFNSEIEIMKSNSIVAERPLNQWKSKDSMSFNQTITDNVPQSHKLISNHKDLNTISVNQINSPGLSIGNLKDNGQSIKHCLDERTGVGFQTASGKRLKLTEDCLLKAKRLVQECFSEDDAREAENKNYESDTVRKTDCVNDRANNSTCAVNKPLESTDKSSSRSSIVIGGFHTAGGREVKLSKESLQRAQSLVAECLIETGNTLTEIKENVALVLPTVEKVPICVPTRAGFSTAGGKSVDIKVESLKKAESLLEESESYMKSIIMKSETSALDTREVNLPTTSGFCSASGKTVRVSDKSLKAARVLLEDNETMSSVDNKINSVSNETLVNNTQQNTEFGLVGGNTANGCESTLKYVGSAAQKIIRESKISAKTGMDLPARSSLDQVQANFGFCTAGGKTISISEDNMKKARSLVEENETESINSSEASDEISGLRKQRILPSSNTGFCSAGGKVISISEDFLKKARSFVEEDDHGIISSKETANAHPEYNLENNSNPLPSHAGFSTAGGNAVTISEDNLSKARSLIEQSDPGSISVMNLVENYKENNTNTKSMPEEKIKIMSKMSPNIESKSAKSNFVKSQTSENLNSAQKDLKKSSFNSNIIAASPLNYKIPHKASNLPVNASVPKGFRPFKPPRVTPKKASDVVHSPKLDRNIESSNTSLPVLPEKIECCPQKIEPNAKTILSPNPAFTEKSLPQSTLSEMEVGKPEVYCHAPVVSLSEKKTSDCKIFDDSIADEELFAHVTSFADETGYATNAKGQPDQSGSTYLTSATKNAKVKGTVFELGFQEKLLDSLQEKVKKEQHKDLSSIDKRTPDIHSKDDLRNEFDSSDPNLDEHLLVAAMVDMSSVGSCSKANSAQTGTDFVNEERSNKRSRAVSTSFSDDEAFQADLERLPKEMKLTLMDEGIQRLNTKEELHVVRDNNCSNKERCDERLFQTPSGKRLKISPDAFTSENAPVNSVQDGQEILDRKSECESQPLQADNAPQINNSVSGEMLPTNLFQTAAGMPVKVSAASLEVARKTVNEPEDILNHRSCCYDGVKDQCLSSANLFQTASGKSVTVSESALQKARSCLEVPDDTISVLCNQTGKSNCVIADGVVPTQNKSEVEWASKDICETSFTKTVHHQPQQVPTFQFGQSVPSIGEERSIVNDENQPPKSLFQTASGKSLSLTKKAVLEARKIMEDSDIKHSEVLSGCVNGLFKVSLAPSCLFKTASGNNVNVSEKSIMEVRKQFSDTPFYGNKRENLEIKDKDLKNVNKSSESTNPSNLLTAVSCKVVNVSKKSLDKVKQTFSELDDQCLMPGKRSCGQKSLDHLHGKTLFQTASGNAVTMSPDALQQAKTCLGNPSVSFQLNDLGAAKLENSEDESQNCGNQEKILSSLDSDRLFQTASGKYVNVSKKVLQEVKSFLSDNCFPENESVPDKPIVHLRDNNLKIGNLFQTASGKSVAISEKALQEVKGQLSDQVEPKSSANTNFPKCSLQTGLLREKSETRLFPGGVENTFAKDGTALQEPNCHFKSNVAFNPFQTCSGKPVNISQKSLKEAKKLFDDCNDTVDLKAEGGLGVHKLGKVSDMQTIVSDESRENGRNCESQISKPVLTSSSGCLFQTCSGKAVTVSKKALLESNRSLGGDADKMNTVKMPEDSSTKNDDQSPGHFQTSSGKSGFVSDKALQQARGYAASLESLDQKATTIVHQQLIKQPSVSSSGHRPLGVLSNPEMLLSNGSNQSGKLQDDQNSVLTSVESKFNGTNVMKTDRLVYKRNPLYSSPEGSLRDHPYRRGRNFIPHRFPVLNSSSNNTSSADTTNSRCINTGFQSMENQSSMPSSFITPYKTNSSNARMEEKKPLIDHSQEEKTSFNPFVSGLHNNSDLLDNDFDENAQILEDEADMLKSAIGIVTKPEAIQINSSSCKDSKVTTPKHVPTSSGDNSSKLTKEKKLAKVVPLIMNPANQEHSESNVKCALSTEIIATLQMARLKQDKVINRKKRLTVKPCGGKLWTLKTTTPPDQRIKLQSCGQNETLTYCRMKTNVNIKRNNIAQKISSKTAEDFRFDLTTHYGVELMKQGEGVLIGDGMTLLPEDDCTAGKSEFYRAFITHENVDPRLISEEWVFNHYRWIVWKLAAYEVYNPQLWAGRCLSPDCVMLQLKYRYDREIDKCERPALRKILEHDDSAGKRLVVCISDIICDTGEEVPTTPGAATPGGPNATTERLQANPSGVGNKVELEVTDGWYGVHASLDTALTQMVRSGRLGVGDKLCVCGGEITGSQDPAHPLQTPSTVKLKLCTNSVRKVKWDVKLGYQPDPRPFTLPLSSLLVDGGTVPAVDLVVTRVYPITYFEKMADGRSVFRCARAEQRAEATYRRSQEQVMEQLYSKLQADMENKEGSKTGVNQLRTSKRLTPKQIECLCTGTEIYEAVNNSREPETVEMSLSNHQQSVLQEYRQSVMEDKRQSLQTDFQKALKEHQEKQPLRKVTALLKIRVAGCHLRDIDNNISCILTVWRPSEDVNSLLTEGRKLRCYNLSVTATRSRLSSSAIQLTATRSTRFQEMTVDENFLDQVYEPREVLTVRDLTSQSPAYGEVDFVGIVLKIDCAESSVDRGCQMLYSADVYGGLAMIRLWGTLQSLHLEDILVVGRCFVGSNLLYKGRKWKDMVTLDMCTEITMFTQNPGQKMFTERLNQTKNRAKDTSFMRQVNNALEDTLGGHSHQTNENNVSATQSPQTPRPGLLKPLVPSLLSPVTLDNSVSSAKKALIQSKKEKLSRYANAPPLSPLVVPVPKTVRKAFRPPRRQTEVEPTIH